MTIFGDRAFARSLAASCVLHGAVVALILTGWHIEQQPSAMLRPIPVTLVKTDETAPPAIAVPPATADAASSPAPAAPSPPATKHETAPHLVQRSTPSRSAAAPPPKPHPQHDATPPAKPSDEITALIAEGVAGRPLTAQHAMNAAGIRSSAPVSDDYLVRLASWLARFQSYPAVAADKHQEGKAIIGFTVARDGTVQRVWVDHSSGVSALDAASVGMVRAASPVPPLPQELSGDSVDFFFPVNYTLSTYQRLFR